MQPNHIEGEATQTPSRSSRTIAEGQNVGGQAKLPGCEATEAQELDQTTGPRPRCQSLQAQISAELRAKPHQQPQVQQEH